MPDPGSRFFLRFVEVIMGMVLLVVWMAIVEEVFAR